MKGVTRETTMGTRCAIFNEPTGQLRYIGHDGYPEGVGNTLAVHYGTQDRVDALYARAASSDMSSLAPTVDKCLWYDEKLTFPGHHNRETVADAYRWSDCEYLYAWDGVRWTVIR
jgi:hypothetical protein